MSAAVSHATMPARQMGQSTASDLEQLPSGDRFELIRGELCRMPNNSADHGNKTMRLSARVSQYVDENNLGECFAAETRFIVAESPDTVLGPDFAFVTSAHIGAIPQRGYLRFAPDIVLETRSPGDRNTEFALKISLWLEYGTQVVWALDPVTKTLTVHRKGDPPVSLTEDMTLDESQLLPGFELPLRLVFK